MKEDQDWLSSREKVLTRILLVLTFVTGIVDAVSVLGLGRVFTANMTGNVVFLAFAVAGAPGFSVSRSLVALVTFLCGAVIGGRLESSWGRKSRGLWFRMATICEAALLVLAGALSLSYDTAPGTPLLRVYFIIGITAAAMGLRNATIRRLAVADLTTTVLTLTLTGIAADSSLASGGNPRIGRRIASVICMFAGAAVGVLLLRAGAAAPLLLSGLLVFVTLLMFRVS
jgi:uncharacterized membrane protein YoaK (UPF0700 family)